MGKVLASKLRTISALAESRSTLPLGLKSLEVTEDGVLALPAELPASQHQFVVDGVRFNVMLEPAGDQVNAQFWAEVGHIPYTAQNPRQRADVLQILRAGRSLQGARFVIDRSNRVAVVAEAAIPGSVTPESLLVETVAVLHRIRPYLSLLGDYL